MAKIICIALLYVFSTYSYSQTPVEVIKGIQNYIQNTSQSAWFDPINEEGMLENGIVFDTSYYILPDNNVFSIIYTLYDKTSIRKTFYYKEGQLIAAIIEEHDVNNSNQLLRFADYFFKNHLLINTTDEQEHFPSEKAFNEGLKLLDEFMTRNV